MLLPLLWSDMKRAALQYGPHLNYSILIARLNVIDVEDTVHSYHSWIEQEKEVGGSDKKTKKPFKNKKEGEMCARVCACARGSERVLQSGRAWFLILQDFNARAREEKVAR